MRRPVPCPSRRSAGRGARPSSRARCPRAPIGLGLRLDVRPHLVAGPFGVVRADRADDDVAGVPFAFAASISLTAPPRSTVCLRAGPLPGPAPAAKTTASAPSTNGRCRPPPRGRRGPARRRLPRGRPRGRGCGSGPVRGRRARRAGGAARARSARDLPRRRSPWREATGGERLDRRAGAGHAELLEQVEPDLAPRGEGRDGVRQPRAGTSPTTAIVAAWRNSATSGPVNVAPTSTPRSSSTTRRVVPGALSRRRSWRPALPGVHTSTARALTPASCAAASV